MTDLEINPGGPSDSSWFNLDSDLPETGIIVCYGSHRFDTLVLGANVVHALSKKSECIVLVGYNDTHEVSLSSAKWLCGKTVFHLTKNEQEIFGEVMHDQLGGKWSHVTILVNFQARSWWDNTAIANYAFRPNNSLINFAKTQISLVCVASAIEELPPEIWNHVSCLFSFPNVHTHVHRWFWFKYLHHWGTYDHMYSFCMRLYNRKMCFVWDSRQLNMPFILDIFCDEGANKKFNNSIDLYRALYSS